MEKALASRLAVPDYWTLSEALDLIRNLQPEVKQFNYHITLGGSVLNKGMSTKDLDLYFHPYHSKDKKPDELLAWLKKQWKSDLPAPLPHHEDVVPATWRPITPQDHHYDNIILQNGQPIGIVYTTPAAAQPQLWNPPEQLTEVPEEYTDQIYKHFQKFWYQDLRIDVFIL